MCRHVLLNLLNELKKSDKLQGLPSILCLFCNWFNRFNNTRAQMLDSIKLMILKLVKIFYTMLKWTSLLSLTKSVTH